MDDAAVAARRLNVRHIKRFFPIFAGIAVVLGLSAFQNIDRGSFGPFQRSLNNTAHGYAIIEDPTASAPTKFVERFEVRSGDCGTGSSWNDCTNDRERSELSEKNKSSTRGTTSWYGWSLFVPENYVNIYPTKVAFGQFHQAKSHPVWMFQNSSGGYFLDDQVHGSTRKYYQLINDADLRGKWHRIEVHARWTIKDDGFFRVWVNGKQKVYFSGQTMTAMGVYFKYGLYRSFISRYKDANGGDEVPSQIVLYANVRRAGVREGLGPPAR